MKFTFKKPAVNIIDLIRNAGYSYRGLSGPPATPGRSSGGQDDMSFIRRVGMDEYPHYHIYVKDLGEEIVLNLHLDQKKPSYEGSAKHNAEYEGELVEREMERVKAIISRC